MLRKVENVVKIKNPCPGEIVSCCANCENAVRLCGNGETVLCRRKGIVKENYHCPKYSFDPLKYIPAGQPKLPDFEPVPLEDE